MNIFSMSRLGRFLRLSMLPALILGTFFQVNGSSKDEESPLQFRIRLTRPAAEGIAALGLEAPVTGRVFVLITRDGESEPREQVDVTGIPLAGKDVSNFAAGDVIHFREGTKGIFSYPIDEISGLPPGDYFVQAFLNVYTAFHRSDGHTVWLHNPTGEGQSLWESPGNAYSIPQPFHWDPTSGSRVNMALELTEVIPPIQPVPEGGVLQQGNPVDTPWVKYLKIRSELVSQFWGRDMYLGANILLPKGYDENPETYYPVIYLQGHYPGAGGSAAPFGFQEGNEFYNFWTSGEAYPFIVVTFRDENPYYDTSYSVDSANIGPYGSAIQAELIPYIEEHFRIQREPWARLLAGGSTGGWEALAMKIWNADFFSGTWSWCPDAVDFHYHQLVNIYEDPNAYYNEYEWVKVERPSARDPDGDPQFTIRQENHWEEAMGTRDRSGGQWDAWEAVYSPVAPDGYPLNLWDPISGVIDHSVAEAWKMYDLNYQLQQMWPQIAPMLDGQLTVTNGMMDTYYLNEATYLLQEFIESADPPADVKFDYGFRQPHCYIGESPNNPGQEMTNPEFVQVAGQWVEANKP